MWFWKRASAAGGKASPNLPKTLEFTGEFGTELVCFLPHIHWLHQHGYIGRRRVLTYGGMRPFYFFLDARNYSEKVATRCDVALAERPAYLPNRGEISARRKPSESFPDYRRAFGGRFGRDFDKPLLVIHNKYCQEWSFGPVNFIAIDTLDRLFERFKHKFKIVYFREGLGAVDLAALGYSHDHNSPLAFDDELLLQRHPEVLSFERLAAARTGSSVGYNELKLMIYADCHRFIASQGGGNAIQAILGGGTLLILHRTGNELRGTYAAGYYRYAADIPPRLMIARSSRELEDAASIFDFDLDESSAIPVQAEQLLQAYAPERSFDPKYVLAAPTTW